MLLSFIFLCIDVGTTIEVQTHPLKPPTIVHVMITATECAASTSQVQHSAKDASSPAPQVVELLTLDSDIPSPQEMELVDMIPTAEEQIYSH